MATLDLILRTTCILLLLLLAVQLLTIRRRDGTQLLGTMCCVAAASFVLTSIPGASTWLGFWLYPLTALCVIKAALLWLFAKGLFRDGFHVRLSHLLVVAVTMGCGLWQQLAFVERQRAGTTSTWEIAASFGFDALLLGLVLMALAETWRDLAGDLVEPRRKTRILFVAVLGGYLAVTGLVQGYNLLLGTRTPDVLVAANLLVIASLALAALCSLTQPRPGSWLQPPLVPDRERPVAGEARLLDALRHAMEQHHLYRTEGLTIGELAKSLGTREHTLRRLINQRLGFRNFNDFLHAYRIREACQRLRRPEASRRPVLSIALEVGYSSIGPFNRAFKARIGMTPTSFRRTASQDPSPAG